MGGQTAALDRSGQVTAADGRPAVIFEHVSLAFDEKVILKDVSFSLQPGHTKIILGASGAGKSMTLKILLGLLKPDGGAVYVNGARVDEGRTLGAPDLLHERFVLLRRGKRQYHLLDAGGV